MKKILVSLFILSLFLPSLSFAQVQQFDANQRNLDANVNYGTRMERFTVGADFRDGYPRSTTTQEFLTGYAWGGDVAGWLQFNPDISLPFLPPKNFHFVTSTLNTITLAWEKPPQRMDDLRLFQGNANNVFQEDAIETNLQNTESVTVQGLQEDTTYKFYLNAPERQGREFVNHYTPVVQATTVRDDGGPAEEYLLTCPPDQITTSSVFLQWIGNIQEAHTLDLLSNQPPDQGNLEVIYYNLEHPQGNFINEDLQPATDYQYQLRVTPNAGGEPIPYPAQPIVCRTAQGDPEGGIVGLNITTLGPDSLFLNWTDRSRQNRLYDLRRVRITPATSVITGIQSVDADTLTVDWRNDTNGFSNNTPFVQKIEKAVEGGAFNPLAENLWPKDNDPANVNVDYDLTENNLTEGTIYQYRIKACATTLVDLRRGGNLQNNLEICAADSNVFQQATRPNAPTNFTVQIDGRNAILAWNDNSAHEDGYELNWLRGNVAGVAVALNANSAAYVYENLEPGQYTFSARAFRNVGENKIYSAVANVQGEITADGQPVVPGQSWLQDNNRTGLTANIFSIVKLSWQNITEKTSGFFASIRQLADRAVKKAFALQYQENFDRDYFVQDRRVVPTGGVEFTPANFPAAYRDSGLIAGTVYLYRLELLDAANGQHLEGTNIIYGAGETIPDGDKTPVDVRVCTRNNFCGTVEGQRVDNNWPENQCTVNADCRNVGSFYTIIKEN